MVALFLLLLPSRVNAATLTGTLTSGSNNTDIYQISCGNNPTTGNTTSYLKSRIKLTSVVNSQADPLLLEIDKTSSSPLDIIFNSSYTQNLNSPYKQLNKGNGIYRVIAAMSRGFEDKSYTITATCYDANGVETSTSYYFLGDY